MRKATLRQYKASIGRYTLCYPNVARGVSQAISGKGHTLYM